jgi:phosphatidylserine/phosphatidylglycerophosphate/cardiolipin synthase-like enzyme
VLRPALAQLGVEVYDYAIPRPAGAGTETFHAKVVLADDNYAYVGSANMNKSSLEYSMELGILVRGEAATLVSKVIDAILQISTLER